MKNTTIKTKIRKEIQAFPVINWGQSQYDSSYIILKWGENPYPPSEKVIKAIEDSLKSINRYPNLMNELKNQLSKYTKIDVSQICLTNGADKAFRLISEVFINKNDEAITFTPSYPVFDSSIKMMGGKLIKIPLDKNFKIPNFNILKTFIKEKTKLVYICNPNNPTGNFLVTNQEIKKLLKLNIIVIIDEAYFEFSGNTAIKLLQKYNNLIILRSFSKTFGLAGLRVAYVLSSQKIIDYMIRIEDSLECFNISNPSLAGAIASLKNYKEVKKNIEKINATKELLTKKMKELNIKPYPSYTSFIMFNLQQLKIKTIDFINRLQNEKIIIKNVSIYSGLSEYDAYMAIPKKDQVEKIINSISKITN